MKWYKAEGQPLVDATVALCAFWGYDMAYSFAIGTWDEQYSTFRFAPDVMPDGQLLYYALIESPPKPKTDQWQNWQLMTIEAQLENILALLRGQK